MKRDWDVIKAILIALDERDSTSRELQLQDFPAEQAHIYLYHVQLLIERRLISGHLSQVVSTPAKNFRLQRLTWEGHDLLDTIRSRPVWERIKTISVEKGIELTLDSVKAIGKVAVDWVLAQ